MMVLVEAAKRRVEDPSAWQPWRTCLGPAGQILTRYMITNFKLNYHILLTLCIVTLFTHVFRQYDNNIMIQHILNDYTH
jgi:hypothetical protein